MELTLLCWPFGRRDLSRHRTVVREERRVVALVGERRWMMGGFAEALGRAEEGLRPWAFGELMNHRVDEACLGVCVVVGVFVVDG